MVGDPEVDSLTYDQLIFKRYEDNFMWSQEFFEQMVLEDLDMFVGEEKNLDPYIAACTEIHLGWTVDQRKQKTL